MLTRMMLVVAMLLTMLAPAAAQEVAPVKYAFLVSVASGDTKANLKTTALALGGVIAGRDPVSVSEPTTFQRFILANTNPEIPVVIVVGVASDVTGPVQQELQNLPPVGVQMIWYGTALTQAQIDAKLLDLARTNIAATAYWRVHAGDTLSGFLPANFTPIQ